jgi:hypothetical protein
MSGFFDVIGRFLDVVGMAFGDPSAEVEEEEDAQPHPGGQPQGGPAQGGQQPVGQPVVQQPVVAQPIVQPQGGAQGPVPVPLPIPPPPTLAERLQTQRAAITAVRQTLGNPIWQLGDPAAVTDLWDTIDAYVTRGRAQPTVQNDGDADQQLTVLAGQVTALAAAVGRVGPRVAEIHALYTTHGALPGVAAEAATIWAPLLGVTPPNEGTLNTNLTAAERAFAAALPVGFNDLPDADKANRFVDMWKLRVVGPIPVKGVGAIYVSSFDGPADRFGVSWELSGLDDWVLHGHGEIVWDDGELNVVRLELPRLHIKPADDEHGRGGTIEIADGTVIAQLCRSSLAHVQKLAKNRHNIEIFARTKFKTRGRPAAQAV